MAIRCSLAFALLALFCNTQARAQYEIALYYNGATNLVGFDCSDPNNTYQVTMSVGDRLIVSLAGDTLGPAGVALALGPAFPCIPLPGFGNALLLDPATILPIGFSTMLSRGRGGYPAWNYAINVPMLYLPASAAGMTYTLQGIVPSSSGLPTFTRAIEITVP